MLKSALIKSTPNKLFKVGAIIKNEPAVTVISLTKYVEWKLKQHYIKSLLFDAMASHKNISTLHGVLEKKYNSLCCGCNKKNKLDFADLFRVHLCWEIQKQYHFLSTLERWLHKYKIKKLYFEPIPLKKTKRYAKDINELVRGYCAKRKIAFEKI